MRQPNRKPAGLAFLVSDICRPAGVFCHLDHAQGIFVNRKAYVEAGKQEAVAAVRVVLIAGARILAERLNQPRALFCRNLFQQRVRELDGKRRGVPARRKGVHRVRMRIGIRKIGLDVVDWRPVGKVRAT